MRSGRPWPRTHRSRSSVGRTSIRARTGSFATLRPSTTPKASCSPCSTRRGRSRRQILLLGVTVQSLAAAFEGALRARALEELQGRLRLNETFVASIGHDLRNPLTAVLNGADLMIARAADSNHRALAERIRSSGRRMYHLVDQLSDLTRARLAGGIRLALGDEVDLTAVVERGVAELRLAHPDRQIVATPVGDARGRWDPVRMEQVVSNLVGNALRHGTGGKPIYVGIDGTRRDRIFSA